VCVNGRGSDIKPTSTQLDSRHLANGFQNHRRYASPPHHAVYGWDLRRLPPRSGGGAEVGATRG
ncbi:hypothetical protein, partial [Thermogutta sp.]|uniref:hypothetical protein n=1 Tax=Thermogutta sp. TaxID=1962930 RepID=UPI00321FC4A9